MVIFHSGLAWGSKLLQQWRVQGQGGVSVFMKLQVFFVLGGLIFLGKNGFDFSLKRTLETKRVLFTEMLKFDGWMYLIYHYYEGNRAVENLFGNCFYPWFLSLCCFFSCFFPHFFSLQGGGVGGLLWCLRYPRFTLPTTHGPNGTSWCKLWNNIHPTTNSTNHSTTWTSIRHSLLSQGKLGDAGDFAEKKWWKQQKASATIDSCKPANKKSSAFLHLFPMEDNRRLAASYIDWIQLITCSRSQGM